MQSSIAVQVNCRIAYLPEDGRPILFRAEGQKLLNSSKHLFFRPNRITGNNRNTPFQNVADDRLTRSREEVRFVWAESKVGGRVFAIKTGEGCCSLSFLFTRKEGCGDRAQHHHNSIDHSTQTEQREDMSKDNSLSTGCKV